MRNGVVVGKFSPLHLGHEYMINEARKQCDRLVIVSYSNPEFKGCEAAVRKEWLKARFPDIESHVFSFNHLALPSNTDPDGYQQWFFCWLLKTIGYKPNILFCSEKWGDACAKVMTEEFGHPVEAVVIDVDRSTFPISGTALRKDWQMNKHMCAPEVRKSFVKKICMLGGESTGKTTLTKALAEYYNTLWVAEYGRELFEKQNGILDHSDFPKIAYEQIAREDRLQPDANGYLFCDTSPLTTFGYHSWMKGSINVEVRMIAKARQYDGIVLCEPDFEFVQDGTRIDAPFREKQQAWYREQLKNSKCPVLEVKGSTEERCALVVDWLRNMK